ncbi:MAG: lamin tail domain-containing protein [Myxococcota bacterium]
MKPRTMLRHLVQGVASTACIAIVATGCVSDGDDDANQSGPCDGIICNTPPATRCDGNSRVFFAVTGTCVVEGDSPSCRYTERSAACMDRMCVNGVCVVPTDPCEPNPCTEAPADTCDVDTAVTYDSGPGVCTASGIAEFSCAYSETRSDCTQSGRVCANAACVDPTDPCTTTACDAPPANRCDDNVAVVFEDPGTCMAVDDVGECTYAQTTTDCGSDVCMNGSCVSPQNTVTIRQLQDTADPGYVPPDMGTVVTVSDVSISAVLLDDAGVITGGWVQESGGGPFSGVFFELASSIDPSTNPSYVPAVGDVVAIEGATTENAGDPSSEDHTTLAAATLTPAPMMRAPAVSVVSSRTLSANAERWEGVLVQLNEAGVTSAPPSEDYTLDDRILASDLLYDGVTAAGCDVFASFTGVVHYSSGAYKLEPRDAADVGAVTNAAPTDTPEVTINGSGFTPEYLCVYRNLDTKLTNTTGAQVTVQSRAASDNMLVGTNPALDVSVPANGEAQTGALGAGTYHYADAAETTKRGAIVVVDEDAPMNQALMPGDLVITEIMQSPSTAIKADGEYFEVYNASSSAVELQNLTIKDDGSEAHTIGSSLVIQPSSYAVLCSNDDPTMNGGVVCDYSYGADITFLDSADQAILETATATVLAAVRYDDGATFPDPTGASMILNPMTLTNAASSMGSNWCASTSTIVGGADLGTPGSANDPCP